MSGNIGEGNSRKKLPTSTILGYGIAGMGNNIAASLFYVYFIFFLTTVAGLSPAVAGIISFIAVVWDGINDPLIGYWSDNCKSKYGRRRPFLISGLIPLCLVIVMMFTNVNLSPGAKAAYYIVANILFWFIFTWVDVPTIALGDSLDGNYDDKTRSRTAWTVFVMIGGLIATDLPLLFVEFLQKRGSTVDGSWFTMAVIASVLTGLAYFVSWNATRGKEIIPKANEDGEKKDGFFKQYRDAFKNRSMRYSMLGVLLIYCGFNGAALPTMSYILTYNLGLDGHDAMYYLLVYSLASILGSYVLGSLSSKHGTKLGGKSRELAIPSLIYGIISILGIFSGSTKAVVIIVLFTLGFCCSAFFLHGWNLGLDSAKVDQYKNGADKGCEYVAFIGFAFKLGGAVGMFLVGLFLELFGFNAELAEQTASALTGIQVTFYVLSGVFMILGALVLLRSPLTRNKLDAVIDAIEKKERGEPVSEEAFADLL